MRMRRIPRWYFLWTVVVVMLRRNNVVTGGFDSGQISTSRSTCGRMIRGGNRRWRMATIGRSRHGRPRYSSSFFFIVYVIFLSRIRIPRILISSSIVPKSSISSIQWMVPVNSSNINSSLQTLMIRSIPLGNA